MTVDSSYVSGDDLHDEEEEGRGEICLRFFSLKLTTY